MAQSGQRKCLCCEVFFDLDHRNGELQRFCPAAECHRASEAASQAAWLAQPQNKDYLRDPVHVARVQAWRAAHPGYSQAKPSRPSALQDSLIAQVIDRVEESPVRGEIAATLAVSALQETHSRHHPSLDTTWARCHQPQLR